MPVQVQQEQLDHCKVALTVQVPPEEIQKAMDTVFNQVAKRTNVPGFRPGKAPRHLLKRFIDEGRVRDMGMERALTNAYQDALKQAGVAPYRDAEPNVELQEEELDPEKGFSFKATVALEPHVHLGDLEGLTARRVTTKITDEDVTKEIDSLRERLADYQPTEVAAADDDRVRATLEVEVEGRRIEEASFDTPSLFQVGANLDQFDAGLRGAKAGEEKTFEFTYPEDFHEEAVRGKTAQAKLSVTEVQRRTVPAADDAFAQKLGQEDLVALRERLRESLQRQADTVAEQEVDDKLIEQVVQRSHAHYPEEMVDREVAFRMDNLLRALERRGLTLDGYLGSLEKDVAGLQDELRNEARQAIETTLVLGQVARENDLLVTDKEIEEEIKRRAEAENVKLSQMRRLLNETGEMSTLENRIFFRKIAEFLRGKAEIREVEA